jgi:enoyl-CoA hydratase/carnithine racemase
MSADFIIKSSEAATRIDLGRPDEGNALTRATMRRLAEIIGESAARSSTRIVVIEARGPQFCRGRDGRGESTAGMGAHEVKAQMMDAVTGVYEAIAAAPVPVLARVQGPAIGFGAALAGACDLTIASDAATFAFSEIKHGIPPVMAIAAVMKKVPSKALAYLIYSGAEIGAEEAVRCGLVSKVASGANLERETEGLVEELASRPRLVLETIKKFMTKAETLSSPMAAEYAGALLALVRS